MKRFKFNVLDIAIIIIILAAVAVGGFLFLRFNNAEALTGEQKTIQFDVEVPELTKEVAESFKIGSPVVYGTANSDTGKVVNVKIDPYRKLMKNTQEGKFVWSTYADKYQATVTIEATVYETDGSYKGSNEEVRIGAKMPFRGKGFSASNGFIIGLNVK